MTDDNVINPEETSTNDFSQVQRKMHFTGTVIKTSIAGALVDIGFEIPGVVHISQLRKEPVNRVEDVVKSGQTVDVWVRRVVPKKNRIELTLIQPLDLEWREIKKDMVIKGKIVRLEKFGAFVDIGAERPGLVHISEITHDYIGKPSDVLKVGEDVEVIVLSANRQKKQIKLSMKALEIPPAVDDYETKDFHPQAGRSEKKEEKQEENIPTAMEIAMREAMERSKEQSPTVVIATDKPKSPKKNNELEDILERTLHNRVRTSK